MLQWTSKNSWWVYLEISVSVMLLETLRRRNKQPRQCVINTPEAVSEYLRNFAATHPDLVEGSVSKRTDGRRRKRSQSTDVTPEIIDESLI